VSGYSDEGFPDFMELKDNLFYIGTQGHPEFKSRPLSPAPLFRAFMEAVAERNMLKKEDISRTNAVSK
jgi:CTP synthase